jgi:ankyrin repeat protein
MTPLHWAASAPTRRSDAAEVIALLRAAGAASLHARNRWGETPLDLARAKGDERAAAALS